MGSVNAAPAVPRGPTGPLSRAWPGADRGTGQRRIRQAVNAPLDRPHLGPGDARGGVPPPPPNSVTGGLEGGFRPGLEPRHEGRGRVSRVQPEHQVNSVREGPDADRLGVEPATEGDDVALDGRYRFPGDQGKPAQSGPHEVAVEAVRSPAGNAVH